MVKKIYEEIERLKVLASKLKGDVKQEAENIIQNLEKKATRSKKGMLNEFLAAVPEVAKQIEEAQAKGHIP